MPTMIEHHYALMARQKHHSPAYQAGYLAYQEAFQHDDNPYRHGSPQRDEWSAGWKDACSIRPKDWPSDDSCIDVEDIINDSLELMEDAFSFERRGNDLRYTGYDLPRYMLSMCLGARAFELHQVEYSDEEDESVTPQQHTVMRNILKLVSQLSFENGRRYERSEDSGSSAFPTKMKIEAAHLLITSDFANDEDRILKLALAADLLKNI